MRRYTLPAEDTARLVAALHGRAEDNAFFTVPCASARAEENARNLMSGVSLCSA